MIKYIKSIILNFLNWAFLNVVSEEIFGGKAFYILFLINFAALSARKSLLGSFTEKRYITMSSKSLLNIVVYYRVKYIKKL